MKKTTRIGIVCVFLLAQVCTAAAGQLPISLERYRAEVRRVLETAPEGAVADYLNASLAAADVLNGLEADNPGVPSAFDALVKKRLEADEKLTAEVSGNPAVRAEAAAYNLHIQPYRKAEYLHLIRLQDELLDRKYFKTETAQNANFIEGYVNGRLRLTRAEHDDVVKAMADEHLGVSPWEAIFRLEPAASFRSGAKPAVLGTMGMSYTFFPTVERSASNPCFRESLWSEYVGKTGGRIGIGAGVVDDETRLLLGAGVQVHAVAVWFLYAPRGGKVMLGLGMSDVSKLKKVLGWFD